MKKQKSLLIATLVLLGGVLFPKQAWALDQVDGVYQIGTAQDWADFCSLHNNGDNQNLNAVLTANITVDGNAMVGVNGGGKPYRGTFNGQGHKLTINYELNEERIAPFRRINGATIKNLIVEGTIITTSKLAAGIVGGIWQSGSVVINCVSNVTINDTNSGDATHGGICGSFEDVNGANTVENCAFVGSINAPDRVGCGGIVGWTNDQYINGNKQNNNIIRKCYVLADNYNVNKGSESNNDIICRNVAVVENCYYVGSIEGLKNDKGAVSKTIGELLSTLGYGWYQSYSYTDFPVPFVDASFASIVDDSYQITNANDLIGFSGYVNVCNNAANAQLTANIDMTDKNWTPIGQDAHDFKGHFDGQGYRINNLTTSAGYNNQALFGQAVGGAIIENVIIDASCNIRGVDFTAGILGHVWGDGVIVRNCGNEADISGTGANAAGIVGCSEKIVHISNCYNTGAITGDRESAAICGWMGSSSSTVSNCYNTGSISGIDNSYNLYRKTDIVATNNYRLAGTPGNQGTEITATQLSSGELAYMLNENVDAGIFHQTLTEPADAHPVPFAYGHGAVYANGDLYCDGTSKGSNSFSNVSGANRDAHNYTDGFCSNVNGSSIVCNHLQLDYLSPVDGYYSLNNAQHLKWFAAYVNQEDKTVNARLTDDVDFRSESIMIGVGEGSSAYQGTFDGQGHTVSLAYTVSQKNVALFRYIANATIRNLITRGTINNENNSCSGGIFAGSQGSTVVENCMSYVAFTRTNSGDATIGGIGAYMHDTGKIRNCAFYGSIDTPSADGNGGLLGYANGGNNIAVENSIVNMGVFTQKDNGNSVSIARNTGSITNTFVVNSDGITQTEQISVTAEELSNGTVFARLFAYDSGDVDGSVWRMDYDTATPHPVLYGNQIAMREDCTNRMVEGAYDVKFYRTIQTGGWNTFCVPFAMNSTQIATYFGSGTKVAMLDESKSSDDGVLHFKTVDDIAAGQAYLVYPISASTSADFNNTVVAVTSPLSGITQAGFTFKGVFEPTTLTAGEDRIVASGNTIVKTSGGSLKGFRAYFKPQNGEARATRFVIDDEDVTGIITLEGEVRVDEPQYNLSGQRTGEQTRGITIKGGKKYLKR